MATFWTQSLGFALRARPPSTVPINTISSSGVKNIHLRKKGLSLFVKGSNRTSIVVHRKFHTRLAIIDEFH